MSILWLAKQSRKQHNGASESPMSTRETAMILDHQAARIWAEHGTQWHDQLAAQRRRLGPLWQGATTMIDRNLEHLRRLALSIAALVVSASFVGVAVLPGLLGLGAG
jgi:hypothetical protein